MQMKNNHSSMGRVRILTPVKYVELNPQIPAEVNPISQARNGRLTNAKAKATAFQCLKNRTRLSKEKANGMEIHARLTSK